MPQIAELGRSRLVEPGLGRRPRFEIAASTEDEVKGFGQIVGKGDAPGLPLAACMFNLRGRRQAGAQGACVPGAQPAAMERYEIVGLQVGQKEDKIQERVGRIGGRRSRGPCGQSRRGGNA